MKKLIEQMLKFGVVGFVCFFIDYLIGIIVLNIILHTAGEQFFELASMTGSALGFTISVIVNYILSFKFVFERKEDMNRKAEFVIFIILSIIGLGLNQLIIWICVGPVYGNVAWLQRLLNYNLAYTAAKVVRLPLLWYTISLPEKYSWRKRINKCQLYRILRKQSITAKRTVTRRLPLQPGSE